MSEGWIALHRGWRDSPIFRGEFSRADAWVWLIEQAAWKPSRVRIKGETVDLRRGELSFSQRFLAEKWGWSKSRVDRFIAELRDESMIETRSKIGATAGHAAGQGQCIISICNYGKYQDVQPAVRGNDSAFSGATAGQQRGKEEQGNKETIDVPNGTSSARPRQIARSIPADWEPALSPAAQSMVDGWPPGHFEQVLAAFLDHAADKGRTSKDWQAAFRTWLTNENKWNRPNGKPTRQHPTPANGIAAALDRRIGPVVTAGEADGYAARSGEGDCGPPIARLAALR